MRDDVFVVARDERNRVALVEELRNVVGTTVSSAQPHYGGELALELSNLPIAQPGDELLEWSLQTRGSSWILRRDTHILAVSEEENEDSIFDQVQDLHVIDVQLTLPALGLRVRFDHGVELEVIPKFEDDALPHWELFLPTREVVAAGPGNNWYRVTADSPSYAHLLVQGARALEAGAFDDALRAYQEALARNGASIAARRGLATSAGKLGQHGVALDALDEIVAGTSRNAEDFANRGIALWNLGRLEEAIESYQAAAKVDPMLARVWSELGLAFAALNLSEDAARALNRAHELGYVDATTWRNLGISLGRLGRHKDALEALLTSAALDADSPSTWHNIGVARSLLGDIERATDAFRRGVELAPAEASLWLDLGRALNNSSAFEDAVDALTQALRLDKSSAETLVALAVAFANLGRYKEASARLAEAQRIDPSATAPPGLAQWLKSHINRSEVFDPAQFLRSRGEPAQFEQGDEQIDEREYFGELVT